PAVALKRLASMGFVKASRGAHAPRGSPLLSAAGMEVAGFSSRGPGSRVTSSPNPERRVMMNYRYLCRLSLSAALLATAVWVPSAFGQGRRMPPQQQPQQPNQVAPRPPILGQPGNVVGPQGNMGPMQPGPVPPGVLGQLQGQGRGFIPGF